MLQNENRKMKTRLDTQRKVVVELLHVDEKKKKKKSDFLFFPRDMNAHAERKRIPFFFQHHGQLTSERALFFCGAVQRAERFSFSRGETH